MEIRSRLTLTFFHRTTVFLAALSVLTMVLGPLVRAEDAGLACPDWPLCFGKVVPPYEYRVYLEFIHRVVAGLLGIGLLTWLIFFALKPEIRARYGKVAALSVFLLITQILLGGATITERLNAYVVKSHLLNAVLFLTSLLWTAWRSGDELAGRGEKRPFSKAAIGWIFAAAVFLQFFLGGRVSANEAGMACPMFPACYAQAVTDADGTRTERVYFPPMQGLVEMHMTHRFMAYAIFAAALFLAFYSERRWSVEVRKLLWIVFAFVVGQVTLGILNVLYNIPVPVTVLHSATGIGLYILSFRFYYTLRYLET